VRLEIRILGPLEALVDGSPVGLGGRRQRAVLAILVAQANEVVSVERLIDGVWGEAPPETAANVLQGYVSALRKALGRDTIATRGRGYAVAVPDGTLDLDSFERHAATGMAEQSAGRAAEASESFAGALSLWRGPALTDLADVPGVRPIAARLDELRLVALERRLEADLDCGRHAEAAAELEPLIAEHPLRERLRALRMLALYRSGRQAEALDAFRAARTALVDELGIEPHAELHELERAILRQDASLAQPDRRLAGPPAAPRRTLLAAALTERALPLLAAIAAPLARRDGGELVLAATVASVGQLETVTHDVRAIGASLETEGVAVRVGVFTSVTPGTDLARMAVDQDAELVIVDAPQGLLEDARLLALLDEAPCDVAIVVADGPPGDGPVLVPFSGVDHDWAAVELGAWLAQSLDRPLRLAGASTGTSGRDASRLLASASLALQRGLGVHADPVIVDPTPSALVQVAADAGLVVVGLSERWRHEGLGRARAALATAPGVTLLVRRGLRPGGLAPHPGDTRFTWTIAGAVG
jgi:DNA-binding SARP family transcriptional activator